jgi:hypothetical protein
MVKVFIYEYFAMETRQVLNLLLAANSHALKTLPISHCGSRLWQGIVAKMMILIEA